MNKVTDPALLAELEGGPKKVTDPEILKALEEQPQNNAVQQTIENIPSSAVEFFSGIAKAVAHPVDTLTGLQRLVSGAGQKIPGVASAMDFARRNTPPFVANQIGKPEDTQIADAVGGFYKDRYGGLSNLRETLIKDPVGTVADFSAVAGLAGAGLRASGLARAAQVANTVSRVTDPLVMTAKAVTSVAKPIYKGVVGTTSGAGVKSVDEALKGNPAFVDAMRGNVSEAEIVEKGKDSLSQIREARGNAYREQLQNLKQAKQELQIDDIKTLADDWLKRYNVTKTEKGLDFSRASPSGKSAEEIKQIYEMVQEWGSKPGDTTPAMLDILKRKLDDFYAEGRTSRAMVTGLKSAVEKKISSAVPEYAKMTQDYAKSTRLIKEMEQALSLKDSKAADTAIRKLTTAIREDKDFRRDLIQTLDQAGGKDLMASTAGVAMNPLMSRSLGSLTTAGASIYGSLLANPLLAGLIPLASPRVVGELSVVLGKLGRAAPYGRGTGIFAYQTGRIPLEPPQQ